MSASAPPCSESGVAEAIFGGGPVAAVLFDMDGLLFDTERLFFQAMQAVGREKDVEVPDTLFLSLIGLTRERNYALMREHYGAGFAAEEFHALCHRHFDALMPCTLRLKPGVRELLDRLDEMGTPRALVTSSSRGSVDRNLAVFNMTHRFDCIVAYGDYQRGKPDPEPYLLAAARLGVEPACCLALEDSFNGVRSAAGAGARTVMVPDLLEPTDEMRELCVAVLPDLHALHDGIFDPAAFRPS